MSTLHCPLCGLRFRYASELDEHAREHCVPPEIHLPPHRERRVWGEHPHRAHHDTGPEQEPGAQPPADATTEAGAKPESSTASR